MSNKLPFNSDKIENVYDKVDNFVRGSFHSARNFFMDNFRLDIREDDEQYIVEAELPGIAKDQITVTMDEGNLSVSVKKEEEIEDVGASYVHRERRYGTMSREVYLKDALNEETVARMEDGILYITVKKIHREDTSQKINIE